MAFPKALRRPPSPRLVYVSSWLKCHHPAVFGLRAGSTRSPMGFYAPAQIVARRARATNVEVRPVDINTSVWDNTLEEREDGTLALRLGFRNIDGFKEKDWAEAILAHRGQGYDSLEGLWRRASSRPAGPEETRRCRRLPLRWGSTGARRCGRCDGCPTTSRCRSLPPRRVARTGQRTRCGAPENAARRTCGGRLPDDAAVAQGASDEASFARALPRRAGPVPAPRPMPPAMPPSSRWQAWCWCASGRARATPSS